MEFEGAPNGSSSDRADVISGPPLDNTLEHCRTSSVPYQQHRETCPKSLVLGSSVVQAGSVARGSLIPNTPRLMHTAPPWPNDFSGVSDHDALNLMAENRAWRKRLREGTTALVNTRLAKTITQEEYALERMHTNHDAAECKRRWSMLVRDMALRERGLLPFINSNDTLN
jgi:hypothetical protein